MCLSVVEYISGCVLVKALSTVLIHAWSLCLLEVQVAFVLSQRADLGLFEVH